jgi:expansin (peptidoglycan-binding protein)
VFDYNSPTCAANIRKLTDNKLYYTFDIISEPISAKICTDALSTDSTARKPIYSALLPQLAELPRDDVENNFTFAYTFAGEGYTGGPFVLEPSSEDFEFSKTFARIVEKLLLQGRIKFHPVELRTGGWQGVLAGVDELRQGKVSGKKLIYTIPGDP